MKKYSKVLLTIIVVCILIAVLLITLVVQKKKVEDEQAAKMQQITKMAQFLNDKYGYELTAEDCTYYREEDYSWHDGGFSGKYYNIPHLAAFMVDGQQIVVADRKGMLSDNGQIHELNAMVCDYFSELIGIPIAYVDIRYAYDTAPSLLANKILQNGYGDMITPETIDAFMDAVFATEPLCLVLYFEAADNVDAQMATITRELKKLGKNKENLCRLEFYICRPDVQLDIQYYAPDLSTDSDAYDDYKFGCYSIQNDIYRLPETYLYAGICQLGRRYDGGLGLYDPIEENGWLVADFQQ